MIHCNVCSNQIQNPTNHTQGMLSELSMLHELTSTWGMQLLKILCNTKACAIVHGVVSNQYITIMQHLYILVYSTDTCHLCM